ncbi:Fe3+-siderophore ABC transporter permease [Bacillus sp. JJ1562]|uniref:Fe3+-siderophore ABC transporter permease n=1 Tax=Bacillus sp. JJ1562 TaxID=3122960 RepID=UPI003002A722
MSIVQVLFLILLWGIPIFRFINFYLKQDKEEQEELKKGIKSPSFLFVDGFRYIGLALFFSGIITSINVIQHFGAFMLFIGWFSGGIEIRNKNIKRSIILMSFGIIGAVTYYFIVI